MLWKVYFWVTAGMVAYSAGSLATWTAGPPLELVLAQLLGLVALVGLFGFVYKKSFGPVWFWRLFLIVYGLSLVTFLVYITYLYRWDNVAMRSALNIVAMLPAVPMYVGLYLYAFKPRKS